MQVAFEGRMRTDQDASCPGVGVIKWPLVPAKQTGDKLDMEGVRPQITQLPMIRPTISRTQGNITLLMLSKVL